MQIINKKTSELLAYKNNAKLHPAEQIDKIAESIKQFGFLNPILINNSNTIIAGHGRALALAKLNIENVPCIIANNLTDAQIKAYRLADNKLQESGWDNELLKIELDELKELDFDVKFTGFDVFNSDAEMFFNMEIQESLKTLEYNKERQNTTEIKTEKTIICEKCGHEIYL